MYSVSCRYRYLDPYQVNSYARRPEAAQLALAGRALARVRLLSVSFAPCDGGLSKARSLRENLPDFRYEFVGIFGVRIHA